MVTGPSDRTALRPDLARLALDVLRPGLQQRELRREQPHELSALRVRQPRRQPVRIERGCEGVGKVYRLLAEEMAGAYPRTRWMPLDNSSVIPPRRWLRGRGCARTEDHARPGSIGRPPYEIEVRHRVGRPGIEAGHSDAWREEAADAGVGPPGRTRRGRDRRQADG